MRVFEPKSLRFGCTCSRERIASALLTLGEAELRDVLAEHGSIDTQCHFCHTAYHFDEVDVEALLVEGKAPPAQLH